MPLHWLVYRHNNQISVVIEPGGYYAALILETSADTRRIATDAINANVAATAPIENDASQKFSQKAPAYHQAVLLLFEHRT
jgi:hypothetical protein